MMNKQVLLFGWVCYNLDRSGGLEARQVIMNDIKQHKCRNAVTIIFINDQPHGVDDANHLIIFIMNVMERRTTR